MGVDVLQEIRHIPLSAVLMNSIDEKFHEAITNIIKMN